ncbi:hypothetical protein EMPS_01299 [Entomortierella parvispora]|uniref:Uncharacterized protein n=1 Tax=Entomortierella parvispora TaxID=205924 RepID=A0A9P3H3A5_9FUNG|nr:hypothetical protein EMPS_01299 [Entomortierella parvispora]
MAGSRKIWSNAVNTLLSGMESILLDEDLQPLWTREHQRDDPKKKSFLPTTPTLPNSHDPTVSSPLKRKNDPLPASDRNMKSQRIADHLSAKLATTLRVSPLANSTRSSSTKHQTGMEKVRGFHRVQPLQDSKHPSRPDHTALGPVFGGISEPRKYKKAVGNRSNPTTPVSSHPPSPGHHGDDQSSPAGSSLAFESFTKTSASGIFLNPLNPSKPNSLFMRRESRSSQRLAKTPSSHHLAMATRLALFHRIHATTKLASAQTKDMDTWIMEQMTSRGFSDRGSFEVELTAHAQMVAQSLTSLGEGLSQTMQQSKTAHHSMSAEQEYTMYTAIQTTVDTMLENSQWLCGPEFAMGINRMVPPWSMHEGSIEQIVHYVQVVESMRETLSGQFQHPQDLAEDLMRSQEVLDYQRTLFGETLRNNGLAWKALGLPAMEGLIQGTQEWVLNLAKTLTIKIRAEVNLALESIHHSNTAGGMEEDEEPHMRHAMKDVMELVLQGALLSASCLELVGKQCPMLVTAWMELTSQNCTYSLGKMNELVLRSATKSAALGAMEIFRSIHLSNSQPSSRHPSTSTGKSRGVYVKTMEIFESMPRLLQCVSEMREEEELDGGALESLGDGYGGGPDEEDMFPGISATSSDQDDNMDLASSSSSTSLGTSYSVQGHPLTHPDHTQQHRSTRPPMQYVQRRLPVDPLLVQRWIAMESLASVLVETGLELCSSLAEILGAGYNPSSSTFNPALAQPFRPDSSGTVDHPMEHTQDDRQLHHQPHPFADMSASARARAAIASLTSIAGGGAMVSGTGGVGLIYVQSVVRLLSKIIEFSGQDSQQEQRLLRVHSSLQNLEAVMSV